MTNSTLCATMVGMAEFEVDDKELRKFSQELKIKRPSQIVAIVRGTLNNQAFATRKQGIKQIDVEFNTRSKWVQSSVLVDKAKGRDTARMFSEVGGKKSWRRNPGKPFDGLGELEFGKGQNKPPIDTVFSRGGIFSKRVRPSLRFNRLGRMPSENEFPGTGQGRVISMLRILDKQGYRGAFRIRRSSKFRKGIYKFGTKRFSSRGRKHREIKMIKDQSRQATRQPKRAWLMPARKKAVTSRTTAQWYRDNFERFTRQRAR